MRPSLKAVTEAYHAVTPCLTVRSAGEALGFYKKAFGASELSRMNGPDGKIVHAEIKIGDSIVFVADELKELPGNSRAPNVLKGTTVSLYLYCEDVDFLYREEIQRRQKEVFAHA